MSESLLFPKSKWIVQRPGCRPPPDEVRGPTVQEYNDVMERCSLLSNSQFSKVKPSLPFCRSALEISAARPF